MFIDYLALMLINMAAGLLVLAVFLLGGRSRAWCPGLAVAGFVAMVGGFHTVLTWPLPGPYNGVFGESSVLLGAVLLALSLAVGKGWSLESAGVYAFVPSIAAIALGIGICKLGLTASPAMAGGGFIISGVGGLLASVSFCVPRWRLVARVAAVLLILAALLWAFTGVMACWAHMKSFGGYKPATMSQAPAAASQPAAAAQPATAVKAVP